MSKSSRSKLSFLLLVALFVTPFIIGAYLVSTGYAPTATTNHGQFLEEVIELSNLPITSNKSPDDQNSEEPTWQVLVYADPILSDKLKTALYHTRQIHIALGKNQERVKRQLITTEALTDGTFTELLKSEYPQLSTATLDKKQASTAGLSVGKIYLADPLGRLILMYELDTAPKGLLKDVKKLLKLSRIG